MVTRAPPSQTLRASAWPGKGRVLRVVVVAAWVAAACAPVPPPAPADVVSSTFTQQVPERPEAEIFAAGTGSRYFSVVLA